VTVIEYFLLAGLAVSVVGFLGCIWFVLIPRGE